MSNLSEKIALRLTNSYKSVKTNIGISHYMKEEFKQVGLDVALILESEIEYSSGVIGHMIHESWLKRNEWAKMDPVFALPFSELPKTYQDRVMSHYFVGLEEKFGAYQSQEEFFADLMTIKPISKNPTQKEEINFYAEILISLQRAEKLLYSVNTVKLSEILKEKGCETLKGYYVKRNIVAPDMSISKSLQANNIVFPLTVLANLFSTEREVYKNGVDKSFGYGFNCSWAGQWLQNNGKISDYSANQIQRIELQKQTSRSM